MKEETRELREAKIMARWARTALLTDLSAIGGLSTSMLLIPLTQQVSRRCFDASDGNRWCSADTQPGLTTFAEWEITLLILAVMALIGLLFWVFNAAGDVRKAEDKLVDAVTKEAKKNTEIVEAY